MVSRSNVIKIILLFGCVLSGCGTPSPLLSPVRVATTIPITPIPLGPEPDWLTILYPKPGQIVSQEEYDGPNRRSFSGSLSVPQVSSGVCIQVQADVLFEVGDFWEMGDVVGRTSMLVDGVPKRIEGELYDGIVLITRSDSEGNEVARVGGPYAFCFVAPLQPGIHRADITFSKTSGEVKSFSWTFETTDIAIPTPTPLPTPTTLDREGEIPPFLKAVYPPPGANILLAQYWQAAIAAPWDERFPLKYSNMQAGVCFALHVNEVHNLGSMPNNDRDWPRRIYIEVDGQLMSDWLYSSAHFWDSGESIHAYCAEVSLMPGEHWAAIHVHPFDVEMVTYGWAFSIEE
jgi:hypothetical protein